MTITRARKITRQFAHNFVATMRKSEKDHSYIEYYYERRIYEDGTYYDRYTGAALYLTDTMLKNLRTSN